MTITKQAKAEQLAQYIAEFIAHNKIDVAVVPMETIVRGYFQSQEKAYNDAGIKALGFLCD